MRKSISWSAAAVTGVLLAVGGVGATAAQAAPCNAGAGISSSAGVITASGKADCMIEYGNPLNVTVVLYVDGENVGSSYKACTYEITSACTGTPVRLSSSSSNYCSRVLVSYKTMDEWEYTSTSTGTSCPS